ncbi:MAG: hypothetical protein KUG82_01160 [Pseudomonadales bacterium]|nr:hypothetical protein [Pseudomonadales bacterium]
MKQKLSSRSAFVATALFLSIGSSSYASEDKDFAFLFGNQGETKSICNMPIFNTSTHEAPPPLGNGKKIVNECADKVHPWGPNYSSSSVMILTSKRWVDSQISEIKATTERNLIEEIEKLTREIQDLKNTLNKHLKDKH